MTLKVLRVEDLPMETLTGTVVSCQIWSETHVHGSSSSQSSFVGPQGGHVSAPAVSISSTTTEKLQLFIRRDDGKEFSQRFIRAGVGIREGNRVSIVYVPKIGDEPMALSNHDTGKSRIFENRIQPFVTTTYSSPENRTTHRILSYVNLIGFLALVYFGFSGDLAWVDILLATLLLLGSMFAAFLVGPKVPAGLYDGIKAAIQKHVDDAMAADKAAAT